MHIDQQIVFDLFQEEIIQGFIYMITNELTLQRYIGQHYGKDWKSRPEKHLALRGSSQVAKAMKKLQRKYTEEQVISFFTIECLKDGLSQDELDEWEKYYIKKYKTIYPRGYNLTHGGNNAIPVKIRPYEDEEFEPVPKEYIKLQRLAYQLANSVSKGSERGSFREVKRPLYPTHSLLVAEALAYVGTFVNEYTGEIPCEYDIRYNCLEYLVDFQRDYSGIELYHKQPPDFELVKKTELEVKPAPPPPPRQEEEFTFSNNDNEVDIPF